MNSRRVVPTDPSLSRGAGPAVAGTQVARGFRAAVCYLLLLNAPWLAVSTFLYISRPLLNLDYLLLAPLLWRRPRLWLAGATLVLLLDLATSVAPIYHMSAAMLLESMRFFGTVHWVDDAYPVTSLVFGLACAAALFWAARRAFARRRIGAMSVLATVVAVVVVDASNGSMHLFHLRSTQWLPLNIAGSSTVKLVRSLNSEAGMHDLWVEDADPHSPKRALESWLGRYPQRSMLVVIVESLGLPEDAGLRAYQTNALVARLVERADVRVQTRPFRGATTAAELRVLCGIVGDYRSLAGRPARDCLPAVARSQGMETVGVHAFSSSMFRRAEWWPAIGISRSLFVDDLLPRGVPACGGAFAGACDIEALRVLQDELSSGPKFVYMLTLNTHLPLYPRARVTRELRQACIQAHVPDEVCQLTAEQSLFLERLGTMLAALPELPMTLVTGDHSPPYAGALARQAYSQAAVPMVSITPKAQ